MTVPDAAELHDFLAIANRAAVVAGEVIMPLYESGTDIDLKADGTPVTAADRDAERAIRDFLAGECPGHGFLGEEFGETPGDGRYRWVLDPIDGTKSFVHHVPLFGTLIALECDGEPVVGVIACHAAGETVSAATGLGAHLNGEPVHVSGVDDLASATVLFTSVQGLHEHHPRFLAGLSAEANLLRTWGDCYGYLAVATGRAEVMLDPVMHAWDVAALYPVIREAGGTITAWDGSEAPGGSCIATNDRLHGRILELTGR
ncbi:MAG: inositol monophosphatase family protein [Dehalococcoidia bacterium]|nr:inositol monophosphatase family protein [Dehalococcoidia bacterium]